MHMRSAHAGRGRQHVSPDETAARAGDLRDGYKLTPSNEFSMPCESSLDFWRYSLFRRPENLSLPCRQSNSAGDVRFTLC
jgi:hypothetical protein